MNSFLLTALLVFGLFLLSCASLGARYLIKKEPCNRKSCGGQAGGGCCCKNNSKS